jgi:hypothetical protein
MKCSVIWDVILCIPLKFSEHFGGVYHLNLQDKKISWERLQQEAGSKQMLVDFQQTTQCFIQETILFHIEVHVMMASGDVNTVELNLVLIHGLTY